jgi:hypothetical protein
MVVCVVSAPSKKAPGTPARGTTVDDCPMVPRRSYFLVTLPDPLMSLWRVGSPM